MTLDEILREEERLRTEQAEHPRWYAPNSNLRMFYQEHGPRLAAAARQHSALAAFGASVLYEWWAGDCCDVDGASLQGYAEEAGLFHQVERHSDGIKCEWCGNEEPCGELTGAGQAAFDVTAAAPVQPGAGGEGER